MKPTKSRFLTWYFALAIIIANGLLSMECFFQHWLVLNETSLEIRIGRNAQDCHPFLYPTSTLDGTCNVSMARRSSFVPPLYGYDSLEDLNNRTKRFPSIRDRVQLYLSDWYHPPCSSKNETVSFDDLILYSFSGTQLTIREIPSAVSKVPRTFILNSNTTLGKLHYFSLENALPQNCYSEYCQDMIQYIQPSIERVNLTVPLLFQFSDDERSKALDVATQKHQPYPSLPHFKKFRMSLLPMPKLDNADHCTKARKSPLPTILDHADVPRHFQPIIYKLKTNRHYGMLDKIPLIDIPWSEKKNQVIFRGTLTGLLSPNSRFTLSTRRSDAPLLSEADAHAKCLELPRCRLVYETNRPSSLNRSLVDAKLVTPRLQHVDLPTHIHSVQLFGNRMTKQELLSYKAIIMVEGNDAGTGLKWALLSNSVVMAVERPTFTSWCMEELLEAWVHYIPLNASNFHQDVYDKMQWVLDHEVEAQEIAKRGSLWIRDLWVHPDAQGDDTAITDQMLRRYAQHFRAGLKESMM